MSISSLALEVHAALLALQLEEMRTLDLKPLDNLDELEQCAQRMLCALKINSSDGDYPWTAQKMAARYQRLCSGLSYHRFPKITRLPNVGGVSGEVILPNIAVESLCAHHFSPMIGNVKLIYTPGRYLVGFSSLVQLIAFFAHRPQLQERLTLQIRIALETVLQTANLAVSIKLHHSCMRTDHASQADSTVVTHSVGRGFRSETTLSSAPFSEEEHIYGI